MSYGGNFSVENSTRTTELLAFNSFLDNQIDVYIENLEDPEVELLYW